MLRWMRRWRERDYQSLLKPSRLFPDIDPIVELSRILGRLIRIVLALATFVAFASQTTRAEAYACNDWHDVNTSSRGFHSPSCGSEPVHREAICRDGSVSFAEPRRGTCSHHNDVERWE